MKLVVIFAILTFGASISHAKKCYVREDKSGKIGIFAARIKVASAESWENVYKKFLPLISEGHCDLGDILKRRSDFRNVQEEVHEWLYGEPDNRMVQQQVHEWLYGEPDNRTIQQQVHEWFYGEPDNRTVQKQVHQWLYGESSGQTVQREAHEWLYGKPDNRTVQETMWDWFQ